MIIYFQEYLVVQNSRVKNIDDSLGSYYASNRASAVINYDKDNKSIIQDREIGRVFAEYKDNLVVIDGENKKEHEYFIPKTEVHHYGDNQVHFNISQNTLKDFEI